MRPTDWREIVALGVVAGAISWLVLRFSYDSLPPIPSNATISLVIVAVAGLFTYNNLRNRLHGVAGAKPVPPLLLARFAALAKALSWAGALSIGGWLGLLVRVSGHLDVDAFRRDAVTGAIALVPSIAVMVSGLLIERLCKAEVPPDDELSR